VREDGLPISEYLAEGHEGREASRARRPPPGRFDRIEPAASHGAL